MKFSHLVFYYNENHASLEQTPDLFYARIKELADVGYDAIELMVRDATEVNVNRLNAELAKSQLQISAIGSGKIYMQDKLCFSSLDKQVRENAVARIKQHIDLSCHIGFPPVIIGSIRGDIIHDLAQDLANIKSCLKECGLYAAQKNVKLAIEPIKKEEIPFINTVQQALEMIKELEIPSVGLTLDNCNMYAEEVDVNDAITTAKKNIFHVQVADIKRYYPSYTSYDLSPFIKALVSTGYDSFISVEPCKFQVSPIIDAKKGLIYLQKIYDIL